ncbi:MAG TPA: hypothetical protein VGJ44_13950, partial [Kribbellaceae bacterium]
MSTGQPSATRVLSGLHDRSVTTSADRTAIVRVLPGVLTAALALALLARHAPALTVVSYTGFVVLGMVLPGLMIWRVATRRCANLVEDLAAGLAVGTACLIIAYLVAA